MEKLVYVRVENGIPQMRFMAERAERYDKKRVMKLDDFEFDQFSNNGIDIDASGKGGKAEITLSNNHIQVNDGINIAVKSEDLELKTQSLNWNDTEKSLAAGSQDEVVISRKDGTEFQGTGFKANTITKSWEFENNVSGTFVNTEETEDNETIEVNEIAENNEPSEE
jgi:LPS export ABC transporter protein LptC